MAEIECKGLEVLWRKEDWLAVWIGLLIVFATIFGLRMATPNLKWTTDTEFADFVAGIVPAVDKLEAATMVKAEAGVQQAATVLKAAIVAGDRKATGDAAKALEEAGKAAKDPGVKKSAATLGKDVRSEAGRLAGKVFSGANLGSALLVFVVFAILSVVAMALLGERPAAFLGGFPLVFLIAGGSLFLAGNYTITYYGLEYVLWCLFLGLAISNIVGVPDWLKPAVRTEFYIKSGLVILGSRILFDEILKAGFFGLIQAVLVVAVCWYLCFWLARKIGVDDDFAALLASAVSICGVSAAIATQGAIKGDCKKLSYVTSITLICAVPMLLLQPLAAKWFGMSDIVAGAWLGGTLDTSGSVVAAGALISEAAMKTGVIVKMSQNVLIGVAAFVLSIVWTFKSAAPGAERPGLIEIWERFPKFVLGFMFSSILFSFILSPETVSASKGILNNLTVWWFALAFTSIGLETNFREIAQLGGGKPALAFVVAQSFNIFWTLLLSYLLFGGVLFPIPDIR
jgi:uncharacterized integral membrane protein (TIGR00698 family)